MRSCQSLGVEGGFATAGLCSRVCGLVADTAMHLGKGSDRPFRANVLLAAWKDSCAVWGTRRKAT